jgi:hypothetical protein
MKRTAGAVTFLAMLGTGAAALGGPYMSQVWTSNDSPDQPHWGPRYAASVPGMVGPWGQPVPVAAPYTYNAPTGENAARAMLLQSQPLDLVQQANFLQGGSGSGLQQAQAVGAPGVPPPPGVIPPANLIAPPGVPVAPGASPVVVPPWGGMGIVNPYVPAPLKPPGAVAAVGALTGPSPTPFGVQRTEVRFVGPAGMKISWFSPNSDGKPGFSSQYLEAPARYNFLQASFYRLKLSDIPNHPGVELYPTLEVVPGKSKTCTFLSHSAVPVSFTEEDFEQVAAGNFVTKVIYLPDPQYQELAAIGPGPEEVVSSRLEPGVDPIKEALRRGSILLVVRLGNIDLEAPNTPGMDAPNPFCPPPMPHGPPMMGPGLPGLGPQMLAPGAPAAPTAPQMPYAPTSRAPGAGMPTMPMLPPGPGPQLPGLPLPPTPGKSPAGGPVGMLPPPEVMKQMQFQAQAADMAGPDKSDASKADARPTPKRRPTLAELAGNLFGGSSAKSDDAAGK